MPLQFRAMQYRELGKTGIKVSEIGLGAWAIGGPAEVSGMPIGWGRTSDDDSLAAIRRARDLGVNFFDTADSYGFGRSESLLGIVLSRKRQDVIIATKVGNARTGGGELRKDFSKQHIFVDSAKRQVFGVGIALDAGEIPVVGTGRPNKSRLRSNTETIKDRPQTGPGPLHVTHPLGGLVRVQRTAGALMDTQNFDFWKREQIGHPQLPATVDEATDLHPPIGNGDFRNSEMA